MGTDLLATVKEQGQRFLEPDEHVLAAFQAKPRGSGVTRAAGGGVLADVGARAIGDKWARKSSENAEAAGLKLVSPMALALTERRLVVFTGKKTSLGTGTLTEISELVSSAPLSEVESIQVKRLLVGKTVTVTLHDGQVKLEVPAGQDAKGFAAEFERIKAPGG